MHTPVNATDFCLTQKKNKQNKQNKKEQQS